MSQTGKVVEVMVVGRRRRLALRSANALVSALALVVVVVLCAAGFGALPALGSTFNPGTGVWRLSPEATTTTSGRFAVPGLARPATVSFDSNGIAHVDTQDDTDLWLAIGYVHARFRLTQMDLARRLGEGTLSAILGPEALSSDEMELSLGLLRTAQRDWATMPGGTARDTLIAYTRGVNDAIDQLTAAGQLPTTIKLLGYTPRAWTPVDTLVIQLEETQTLSFSDSALFYSYAAKAMPSSTFTTFFPDVSQFNDHPYDPGPYVRAPLDPLPEGADPAAAHPTATGVHGGSAPPPTGQATPTPTATGISQLLQNLSALPPGEVHQFAASNAWAVSGSHTASGNAMLAADPHLGFNLPAIWYEMEGTSPGYHFEGVTIPGTPVPLMGRTSTFSWGITDAQHPTTLYYLERTDGNRPDEYYWDGAWRAMRTITYSIAVKGAANTVDDVRLTVHGPVLQLEGQTVSVWWAGSLPSENIADVLTLLRARDFAGFRDSLRNWSAPALNFVYADQKGNIGAFDVGAAPQVPGHDINLPLPGDGSADIAGTIPYDALPHVYDPRSGYVVSANQREVTAAYPYQYGNSYDFSDLGYRANEIAAHLANSRNLTAADFQRLQTNQQDEMDSLLVPALLSSLAGQRLSTPEQRIAGELSTWNDDMSTTSALPLIAQNLANHLVYLVFQPWWTHFDVPDDPDTVMAPLPFGESATRDVLLSTALSWVEHDPGDRYLSPPKGPSRTAADVLRQDFHDTVSHLVQLYGTNLANWQYGRRHQVVFPSLLQSSSLDRGPYPRGGDELTINAADGADDTTDQQVTNGGPSWRFVIDWGTGQAASVYPGGQSESPLSAWYDNGIPLWRTGRLWPMRFGSTTGRQAGTTVWRLTS